MLLSINIIHCVIIILYLPVFLECIIRRARPYLYENSFTRFSQRASFPNTFSTVLARVQTPTADVAGSKVRTSLLFHNELGRELASRLPETKHSPSAKRVFLEHHYLQTDRSAFLLSPLLLVSFGVQWLQCPRLRQVLLHLVPL
jgi:hypothetical protein